ncbi:MAG: TraR/DksA C4-type zinc finger protein [Proteobacteria bacterium]|nr:TraR/DksA C4-type zinc finger protein [Pseudomonadota bacterium]
MDQEKREHYLKVLLQMRMELALELQRASEGARSGDDKEAKDPADMADSSYAADYSLARGETLNSRIREIDEAVERIRDGSYGVCIECGELIPEGRLQVRPVARYCAHCKENLEKRGEKP